MGSDSELIRLEAYVGRLLDEFSHLRAEKQQLEQQLQEQQAENKRLKKALDSVDSERTDICGRVNSLIERLERWESELEGDTPDDAFLEQKTSRNEALDQTPGQEKRARAEEAGTAQKRLFNT